MHAIQFGIFSVTKVTKGDLYGVVNINFCMVFHRYKTVQSTHKVNTNKKTY